MDTYDCCIVGSGFSGSLLAWILAKSGRKVAVVDSATHPRFAIGESSTPLADFLLEQISEDFNLPQLQPLSRYGSWLSQYPHVTCGLKRGFSYFAHRDGEQFQDSSSHESSYLVSASTSNKVGDTHWLRSDVDAWFAQQAESCGVSMLLGVESRIQKRDDSGESWEIVIRPKGSDATSVRANLIVDASGSGQALSKVVYRRDLSRLLQTRNSAVFGHFKGVASMAGAAAQDAGLDEEHYRFPFHCDDAAQHHMLGQDLWCWMLRFRNGVTSVGIVGPQERLNSASVPELRSEFWDTTVGKYPTLARLLADAQLVAPSASNPQNVAVLGYSARISRLIDRAGSPLIATPDGGWISTPSSVGIVDPMHSTGIAHSLFGVQRIASMLLKMDRKSSRLAWALYSRAVVDDVLWIDELISLCYTAQRVSFEAFTAACSLYFVAAIHCERRMSQRRFMDRFLLADDQLFRQSVRAASQRINRLASESADSSYDSADSTYGVQEFVNWLRDELTTWNDVGLLESALLNRVSRSSAPK